MGDRVNVLILGHSFVRRFRLFLEQDQDNRTSCDMNVEKANISYLGIGGRTVSKLFSSNIPQIKTLKPRVILLEIGTNDLCDKGRRPEWVGSDIEHLVSFLHTHCGVLFIMVCLVIHHSTIPVYVYDFNEKVDVLNQFLRVVIEPLEFAEWPSGTFRSHFTQGWCPFERYGKLCPLSQL